MNKQYVTSAHIFSTTGNNGSEGGPIPDHDHTPPATDEAEGSASTPPSFSN